MANFNKQRENRSQPASDSFGPDILVIPQTR
jgi:hypothetical protein